MAYKAVLIDDNKNTVLSLEYSLEWENLGIELAGTAYDGRSGKELIEKTDPDIIISPKRAIYEAYSKHAAICQK